MRWISVVVAATVLLFGCSKEEPKSQARPPIEVTVITVAPRDTPVSYEYVGQTQSSHQVQIRARVNGFLDKRVYTEGSMVKTGEVMFLQDKKPFQAQLDVAKGALAEQQARLQTANDNLAQVKPLAALNALSQKELDDATGQQQAAAAAVQSARANVEQAELNLGYTTITTPVTGLSSYARVQDGAYVNAENSLLTYVEQVDPIWVNFTLSENDMLRSGPQQDKGVLKLPPLPTTSRGGGARRRHDVTRRRAGSRSPMRATTSRRDVPAARDAAEPDGGAAARAIRAGASVGRHCASTQSSCRSRPFCRAPRGISSSWWTRRARRRFAAWQVGPWYGDDWFITGGPQGG